MQTPTATFAMAVHTASEIRAIDGMIESIWERTDLEQTPLSAGRATLSHNAFLLRIAFDPSHRRGAHGVTLLLGIEVNPSSIIIQRVCSFVCSFVRDPFVHDVE